MFTQLMGISRQTWRKNAWKKQIMFFSEQALQVVLTSNYTKDAYHFILQSVVK